MSATVAYLVLKDTGEKIAFDGILSVTHALSLKTASSSDTSDGYDYVNNARNLPDVVTLEVLASDIGASAEYWSAQLMRTLAAVKEQRRLLQLLTHLKSYDNMLLTDFTVVQDESNAFGWSGSMTFTRAEERAATAASATDDRSSTPSYTGSTTTYIPPSSVYTAHDTSAITAGSTLGNASVKTGTRYTRDEFVRILQTAGIET